MNLFTTGIDLNRRIWIALLVVTFVRNHAKSNAESNISHPMIVFTNVLGFEMLNLDTLTTHNLFSNGHTVFDIDVLWESEDHKQPQIFWSDFQERKIFRATLNNSRDLKDVEAVVKDGIGAVEGIAVDWIARNLYWVDSRFGQIEFINLDNGFRTILTWNLESPRAIAVDSAAGLLFWTDWDKNTPKIERCSTSGRERMIVVDILSTTGGVGGLPNGLTLDYNLQRIYWIDAKSNSIHSSDYKGLFHRELLTNHSTIEWPFGLCLFEDSLFWVDAKLKTVNKVKLTNVSDVQVLHETYQALYGITILDPKIQPLGQPNPCVDNSGCSHLCTIHLNGGSVCHCPQMMTLGNDEKTCKQIQQIVLVSERYRGLNLIFGVDEDVSKFSQITSTIVASPSDSYIFGPELDLFTGYIYWADCNTNSVWKASTMDGLTSRVLDLGFGNLTGFAADWVNNKFYYSMLGPHHGLFSCSLQNFRCVRIFENVTRPLSVVVQSNRNELYWIEAQNRSSVIRTANKGEFTSLDDVIEVVISAPLARLNGLTVDKEGNAFWIVNNSVNKFHDKKQSVLADLSAMGNVTALTSTRDKLIICIDGHNVYSMNKDTGRLSHILYSSHGSVTALHYVEKHERVGTIGQENVIVKDASPLSVDKTVLYNVTTTIETSVVCLLTCHNGGVCKTNEIGLSYCECMPGFLHTNCELHSCDGFCRNGQCLIDVDYQPRCSCEPGYYGDHCEFSLCTNFCIHGQCDVSRGRPVCRCPRNYWGHKCQFEDTALEETSSTHLCDYFCLNGGTCVLSVDQIPRCSCRNAYSGLRCETDTSIEESNFRTVMVMSTLVFILALALLAVLVGQKRWKKVLKIRSGCASKRQRLDKNFSKCKEMHILGKKQPSVFCPTHVPQSDEKDCDRIFLLTDGCQEDDFQRILTKANGDDFIV